MKDRTTLTTIRNGNHVESVISWVDSRKRAVPRQLDTA